MEYLLLIYNSEADGKKMSAAEQGQIFQEYMAFTQDMMKSGQKQSRRCAGADPTATTVRVRNGKTV